MICWTFNLNCKGVWLLQKWLSKIAVTLCLIPSYSKSVLIKKDLEWAVVVAQLVERLFPLPQICSSNPIIGITTCIKQPNWWDKINEKETKNVPFKRIWIGQNKRLSLLNRVAPNILCNLNVNIFYYQMNRIPPEKISESHDTIDYHQTIESYHKIHFTMQ